MRELTSHRVNGLNEAIRICVIDEPGAGGANHLYDLTWRDGGDGHADLIINFQHGPISESGVNGISNEALLAIVEDRLACFQAGDYACPENKFALEHVREAMRQLQKRTLNRVERGVEGTSAK